MQKEIEALGLVHLKDDLEAAGKAHHYQVWWYLVSITITRVAPLLPRYQLYQHVHTHLCKDVTLNARVAEQHVDSITTACLVYHRLFAGDS